MDILGGSRSNVTSKRIHRAVVQVGHVMSVRTVELIVLDYQPVTWLWSNLRILLPTQFYRFSQQGVQLLLSFQFSSVIFA